MNDRRFLDLVENDVKKGGLIVSSAYYSDIVRLISQPRYLHDVRSSSLPDFLNCANNLLALRVVTCIVDTIEHLLQTFEDKRTVPLFKVRQFVRIFSVLADTCRCCQHQKARFKFIVQIIVDWTRKDDISVVQLQLKCENNELFLSPTMDEICRAFHSIVEQISHVGQQLPPLDSWVGVKIQREYIKVALPELHLEETHRRMVETLQRTFQPFNSYVERLYSKFKVVFDPETRRNIVAYASTGRMFQEYVSKVEDLNQFIREINGMVNHCNTYTTILKHECPTF